MRPATTRQRDATESEVGMAAELIVMRDINLYQITQVTSKLRILLIFWT